MAATTTHPAGLRSDARRNREAVLAAAKEQLAKNGLNGPMDEIARAAGVGVGTVYRHFPSKDALVHALVADRFARLAERAREGLDEDDPWQAFCDFIRYSAELQMRDRALSQFLAHHPELGHEHALGSGLADASALLMARAQREGGMRQDAIVGDIPTLICGLGAITAGASGTMPELNWERYVAIMLDGLRAPGQEPLPPPKKPLRR
jgi:AcrR family transcriptional regulator